MFEVWSSECVLLREQSLLHEPVQYVGISDCVRRRYFSHFKMKRTLSEIRSSDRAAAPHAIPTASSRVHSDIRSE
jgi:hypothetical protein